ncbi:Uncharacterized protein APZ42_029304 [Daphnia magna]|uniref:Uncharacterized protein n=1 Tax=Daphnia magna TaxID=35525 RepID=A0A164PT85_9CRUS|nr:Uncharacterized protein APZ42_029304 [Daphnia magna]
MKRREKELDIRKSGPLDTTNNNRSVKNPTVFNESLPTLTKVAPAIRHAV